MVLIILTAVCVLIDFSRNELITNDHWRGLLVLIIVLSLYLIDECMWGWFWQCWSVLINLLCHNRNLLIMSMAVFLTTAVSTAPLEGKKKRSYVLYLISFYYFCLERRLSVCLPEKELEEVEVEATEEGEVSEEEEGRPCVCERSQLLSWKADSCQIVHEA